MADPDKYEAAYATLAASLFAYLAESEVKIKLSCMTKDLNSDPVLSNGWGGFNLGARSWLWFRGCSGTEIGAGARAASHFRISLAMPFWKYRR